MMNRGMITCAATVRQPRRSAVSQGGVKMQNSLLVQPCRFRGVLAAFVVLCTAWVLVGCASVSSGATSEAVHVEADLSVAPSAAFDTPLEVSDMQRTVITRGRGDALRDNDTISMKSMVYRASDGSAVSSDDQWRYAYPVSLNDAEPGIRSVVSGLPSGSRVVVTATAEQFFGDDRPIDDLQPKEGVVVVMDVSAYPAKDRTTVATLTDDEMPEVTFDGARPVLVAPSLQTAPPAQTVSRTLSNGTGDALTADDTVTFRALTAAWGDGGIVGDDFASGASSRRLADLPAGLQQALSTAHVGDTLEVVVPPSEGPGDSLSEQLRHETLVFVITIDSVSLGE